MSLIIPHKDILSHWLPHWRSLGGRRLWGWIGAVAGGFLIAAILTLYFLDWNTMRGPVGRYLSRHYGREVRIDGDLKVALFTLQPRIDVSGLYVGNPGWVKTPHGAALAHGHVEFRLLPLLFRWSLVLPVVTLDRPDVLVVRDESGRTNWDRAQSGNSGWKLPPIRRFLVRDGHLEVDDALRRLHFTGTVNSSEQSGGQKRAAFALTGNGTLNGNVFTAELHGGPLLNVDEGRPYDFTADIHAGPTHVTAGGAIDHPFHLDRLGARLAISGPDLADLYYLTGLPLPGTPAYSLRGNLRRDGAQYRLTSIAGTLGNSDLSGDLAIDVSHDIPLLTGRLASKRLSLDDLGALFGGGKAAPAASALLLPEVTLHTERLRQMNAELDYSALAVASRDFPLRGFGTHVSLQGAVLALKPLAFQFPQGKLSGELKIDARRDVPLTSVDARFTDIRIENFIKNSDKPLSGMLEARAKLSGRGRSVHEAASNAGGQVTIAIPGGGMRHSLAEWLGVDVLDAIGLSLAGDNSNTRLRCAVAGFDAKNGVLTTQQFVLDTDPVRIDGAGHVDLHDESLALTIQGRPKNFQLFRVKVPVLISGKLAAPVIAIDPKPALVQGGIGVGLGAINPFAAILAFIDPGLARDANCAALLAQAKNTGAPVKNQAVQQAAPVRK